MKLASSPDDPDVVVSLLEEAPTEVPACYVCTESKVSLHTCTICHKLACAKDARTVKSTTLGWADGRHVCITCFPVIKQKLRELKSSAARAPATPGNSSPAERQKLVPALVQLADHSASLDEVSHI